MFTPANLKEDRVEVLHSLIKQHPLGAMVINAGDGPTADHIPFILHDDGSINGVLRGHVAKRNPVVEAAKAGVQTLVIFQGPQVYITPSWYPSKREHGKAVPTWNYALVHAHGTLSLQEDKAWLREHLDALTHRHEHMRSEPWAPSDAPVKFIDQQIGGILGVQIKIDRFEGKWKVSQTKNVTDRAGVVEGLRQVATDDAKAMAELVKQV